MNAEAYAAASGPLILTLMQSWLAHVQTAAETLVSDPPPWAPPDLVAEAARVAAASRQLTQQMAAFRGAFQAMTRQIPDGLGDTGEPWPGAEDPWR